MTVAMKEEQASEMYSEEFSMCVLYPNLLPVSSVWFMFFCFSYRHKPLSSKDLEGCAPAAKKFVKHKIDKARTVKTSYNNVLILGLCGESENSEAPKMSKMSEGKRWGDQFNPRISSRLLELLPTQILNSPHYSLVIAIAR